MEKKVYRLLIVDDEPHVRGSIVMVLKHFGYDPIAVDGAEAAIKNLKAGQFDLVTIDQSMHGTAGNELAEQIKGHWPAQRILMISAYADMLDASTLQHVDGVLAKPFEAQALTEAIAKLLEA